MKSYETILAEAIRVDVDETTGKVYLIFEIKDEKFKKKIISSWVDDIEFRLINKHLVDEEF